VGCNRQPIAAVRRVGIGTNIVALGSGVVGGSLRDLRVTLIVDSEIQTSNAEKERRACCG
jgi:hypothetical protein